MERRSPEAQAYRRLYKTAAWKALRLAQLSREPLCRYCKDMGRITQATVADHIKEHKGDPDLFFHGELQSLCATHHSSTKAREERRGREIPQTGLDGWPVG